MPEIEDPSSVVQTRVRFQESFAERAPSDSDAAMDLSGDEAKEERGVIHGGAQSQTFELQEDPSFWKDHNVQVVIRIRPLSTFEISLQGYNKCVRQDSCQTVTWTGHPESRFTFDLVADEHVSQEKLFKVAGVPMVDNCVAGYNSCMFAYGQTGSGKTHTMLGDIEGGTGRHSVNCGMTPRVFEYLFARILKEKESRRDEKLQFTCRCSFLEIYNEHILDLLEPSSSNLQLREDAKKGIHVENLKEFEVSSARDVMQQLIQGAANRKVAATNMNRASSRSHSVFTCIIESKWESQGVIHHRFARLNLVDLAGSERQKASGAEGERLKEATNINKSLSTLGLVIMNLVSISNKKSMHVPYRDSKLTFLLQDSLGGNSKTIIIANISPSNCCALETLSTLKFAQRAKFIRNNAMVNEDASGDVLAMRLQIQQLKKEVNRLRGLSGGSEIPESNDMSGCIPGSPTSFKWDGGHGSFSPLTFDKRLSQRKEYEAALVAVFRREQDKEAALKALTAGKQAAEQLATQRTEEVRSLKMILRFREEGIKRLEAVASGKLLAQFHLLQEKEEILKEMEVLRNQVDRNPERTRFAMENLQLKEEVRRLQSFVEEGEREMMNEQITLLQDKLLEALDWKLMHEKDSEGLSLSWESSINEENEFLRLQAIQNEREIEALRRNLSVCLEAKEKLERRVDDLVLQLVEQRKPTGCQDEEMPQAPMESATDNSPNDQMDLKTMVDVIAAATQREAEAHEMSIILVKENEELRIKIRDLVEDNKLIDLCENAAREGAGKRSQVALRSASAENQLILPQNLAKMGSPDQVAMASCSEVKDVEDLEHQLRDMHEENDKLMGLYERAMQERDEFKRTLTFYENSRAEPETKEEINCPEENVEVYEEGVHPKREEGSAELQENDSCAVVSVENLCLVANKLDQVQDKLATAGKAFKTFGDIEKAIFELDDISGKFSAIDREAQLTQQEITTLQLSLSELKGRKTVGENKLLELKESLYSFSSRVQYSEERELSTRASLDAYSRSMKRKNEELRNLQLRKDEINTARSKSQQSESELRDNIERLKLKLQDAEARRKESERVLFAVDNLDRTELPTQRTLNFGKASELLKSEEERTEIRAELKQSRERLASVRKETVDSKKMSEDLDSLIESLKVGIACESASMHDVELDLQKIIDEKKMLLVMRENLKAELGKMLIDFECDFESVVKEGEIQLCEEALKVDVKKLDKLREKQAVVREKLNHLMQDKRCSFYASEELEEELGGAQRSLTEAKSIILLGING